MIDIRRHNANFCAEHFLRLCRDQVTKAIDQFDMLAAIQDWVENRRAPDRIIASGRAFADTTRPLCPYPKVARYDAGDTRNAASFSCR